MSNGTTPHKCANCGCEQPPPPAEETTVITVRMPKSLHKTLKGAAHDRQQSLNALCVDVLGQFAETGVEGDLAHA